MVETDALVGPGERLLWHVLTSACAHVAASGITRPSTAGERLASEQDRRISERSNKNKSPTTRLLILVSSPKASWPPGTWSAPTRPLSHRSATARSDAISPTTKASKTSAAASLDPAAAAVANRTTWLGVSAPLP
jgi:hypothetical protein